MTLFIKSKQSNTLPVLTSEKAMEIYNLLKTKDANTLFLEDNIPTEYSEQVLTEIKRLESEMVSKMNGSFIVEPKEPATYDDEGKVLTEEIPAEYFNVTTETNLKNNMNSDLLDISTVVTDIRIWSDGDPDSSPTWTKYKASFGGN